MHRKGPFLSACLAPAVVISVIVSSPARAAEDKNATGTLTVDGRKSALSYAYAAAQPGAFDKTKTDIRVVLSESPLSDEFLFDEFAFLKADAATRPQAVELLIDEDRHVISGQFYLRGAKMSQFSATGMHRFEPKVFDGKTVDGRLFIDEEKEFAGVRYRYEATFSAAVRRKPVPKPEPAPSAASVKEAEASPQAKAYRAYLKAVHAGDYAAFKKLLPAAAAPEFEKQAKELQKKPQDLLGLLGALAPKELRFLKVEVKGDTATLTAKGKTMGTDTESTGTIELVKENGEWKVGKQSWKG